MVVLAAFFFGKTECWSGLPMSRCGAKARGELHPPCVNSFGWDICRMIALYRYGIYLLPLLQIACMIHAHRTGRPYNWFWFILLFPPFGAIAYIIMEVLPGTNWDRLIDENLGFLTYFKKRRLERLADQAEFSPTVDNRMAYGEELARQHRYDEAIEQVRDCLSGAMKDDPHILLALARLYDEAGRWQEVLDTIHRFKPEDYQKAETPLKHLCAVALDNLEHNEDAERLYRELLPVWPGEEVRCRLAHLLLTRGGHESEARKLLEEIMTHSRRGSSHFRTLNRHWIAFARQKLKGK